MMAYFLTDFAFSKEDVVNIITLSNLTPKGRASDIRLVTSPHLLAADLNREIRFLKGWKNFRKIPTKNQICKTIKSSIKDSDQSIRRLSDLSNLLNGFADLFSNDLYENLSNNISDAIDLIEDIRVGMFEIHEDIIYSDSFLFQPRGIQAETYFIGYILPNLYQKHTNKKIGFSVNEHTKKPYGPMLRFIKNCAKLINIEVNEKDIVNCLISAKKAIKKAEKSNS